MSKFLPNLLLQFSKALLYSKIKFYSEKNFSFTFGSIGPPANRPIRPLRPASPTGSPLLPQAARARSAHPGLRGFRVFAKSCLFFEFAQPDDDAFSLCHRHVGPTCQLRRLPHVGRPRSKFLHAAALPRRCPAPRMLPSFYSPPSSLSPLNPLQTER
jgi:hypothetical protein